MGDKIDGAKLRIARAEKGLSRTRLSEISGVTRKTIGEIENNKRLYIRKSTITQIANALDKPINFLDQLGEDDFMSEDKRFTELTIAVMRDIMSKRVDAYLLHGSGDDYAPGKWLAIAGEEFGEICQALQMDDPWSKETDKNDLYDEITDAAAVLLRWAETIKARKDKTWDTQ